MKITDVRARVVEWKGKTVPPQPHFCTNPVDLLDLPVDAMGSFRFHSWLIVEVSADTGEVGIGNAALSPRATKEVIDSYLKPILVGANPFDCEFLWQHMYRRRSEEHTSELQSRLHLVCRLLLEKKKKRNYWRCRQHKNKYHGSVVYLP